MDQTEVLPSTLPLGQTSSCSVQSLGRLGCWGDRRADSTEILFWSFLQEAVVCSSAMGRDVHPDVVYQHFLCQPQRCSPFKVPWRTILEGLSGHVTCPNCTSFHLLTVAKRGSWGPQGSWSCSAPSHWSCAPSRKFKEASSSTWLQKPGSCFQRQ